MKRIIDILAALFGLAICGPFLLISMLLLWLQDFGNPFYISNRIGRHNRPFRMLKLRTMIVNADKSGVLSTSATDQRITSLGKFLRRYKLDEIPQLLNVLKGEMSLVGPRPNVSEGVAVYNEMERGLLKVTPGITDIASIVFSDEAEILKGSSDPDGDYDRLIRPYKSRLGLIYVEHHNILLDFKLIWITLLSIVSRQHALLKIQKILIDLGTEQILCEVCLRKQPLAPIPPPNNSPAGINKNSTAVVNY